MFGFTNDRAQYDAAIAWRDAAIADGWEASPAYDTEDIGRACRLRRDGFEVQVITREKVGKWKYEAQVNVWGPDGMCVNPMKTYNWTDLVDGLRVCDQCKKTDRDTKRVGFANRVCAECFESAKQRIEVPGWCD